MGAGRLDVGRGAEPPAPSLRALLASLAVGGAGRRRERLLLQRRWEGGRRKAGRRRLTRTRLRGGFPAHRRRRGRGTAGGRVRQRVGCRGGRHGGGVRHGHGGRGRNAAAQGAALDGGVGEGPPGRRHGGQVVDEGGERAGGEDGWEGGAQGGMAVLETGPVGRVGGVEPAAVAEDPVAGGAESGVGTKVGFMSRSMEIVKTQRKRCGSF